MLKEGLRGSICQWGKEIKHALSRGVVLFAMPLTYLSNGLLRAQGTNGCTGLKMMDGGGKTTNTLSAGCLVKILRQFSQNSTSRQKTSFVFFSVNMVRMEGNEFTTLCLISENKQTCHLGCTPKCIIHSYISSFLSLYDQ